MESGKIFGIGLSRTGTTSLHMALLQLKKASIHYPLHAASYWLGGDFSQHDPLAEYDACLDLPTSVYFRELDKAYPGSRFILTMRNENQWAASIEKFFASWPPPSQQTQLRDMVRLATYGMANFHQERYIRVFNEHNEAVKKYFKNRPDELLVMDISTGDGWDKLCPFIRMKIPEIEFPKLSSPAIGILSSVSRAELADKSSLIKSAIFQANC